MWSKVKSALGWLAGVVIGFLLLILGIKNKQLDKKKEQIEDLEKESKVKDVVIKQTDEAKKAETKQAQEIVEAKEKEAETIENVEEGKTSYNDLIGKWNEKK